MSYLEGYLYSEGPASSSTYEGRLNTANTIVVNEGSGYFYARLQSGLRFTDALAAWAAELNAAASLSGVYTVSLDLATNRVTIATSNAVSFALSLQGNLSRVLGFTSTGYASAVSHTGETTPGAHIKLVARECHPASPTEQVEMRTYRHQRAFSVGFSNSVIWKLQLYFSSADLPAAFARQATTKSGYALTGQVRLSGNGSAYSATNLGGYMDGFVVGTSNLRGSGDAEEFIQLTMLLGQ